MNTILTVWEKGWISLYSICFSCFVFCVSQCRLKMIRKTQSKVNLTSTITPAKKKLSRQPLSLKTVSAPFYFHKLRTKLIIYFYKYFIYSNQITKLIGNVKSRGKKTLLTDSLMLVIRVNWVYWIWSKISLPPTQSVFTGAWHESNLKF